MSDETSDPVPPTRSVRHSRTPWYERAFVVIGAVTALAGGLRFYHLSTPHAYVFDEVYYAKDGCFDAGYPYTDCKLDGPYEQTLGVHPPLGRWIIAGSEWIYGNRPYGWRFASAVAGTLTVLLLSLLTLRLFGSVLWAGAAGLLLATENLNFVQSRVSMLDIFTALFVVAGFLFLVLDRQWIERRTPARAEIAETDEEARLLNLPPDRAPSPILRPWMVLEGVAFGAAVATKWNGATALAAAILLTLGWEAVRRRRLGLPTPIRDSLIEEGFSIFAFLIVLPIAIYFASYLKYFTTHHWNLKEWWTLQRSMADFGLNLRDKHPYASPAWSWILMKRPVAYYFQCYRQTPSGCASQSEILGMGHPLIFWLTLATVPYAVVAWFRKRDWRAGLIALAVLLQYVPWMLTKRTSFLFYVTPITPFMVLALVYVLRDVGEVRFGEQRRRALLPLSVAVVAIMVIAFAFFLPVLTGRRLSYDAWHMRIWFDSWI